MRVRSWLWAIGLVIAGATLATTAAEAQRRPSGQNWVQLGEQTVGFGVDRDTIQVGRSEGRFRGVKLIVRGADIHLIDLKVIYARGDSEDLAVNRLIRAGTQTEELDLKGTARSIDRVELVYRARPGFAGRATVELWGNAHSEGRGDRLPPGLVELDHQRVNLADSSVRMPVGTGEGRHRLIRLRSADEQIFIRRIEIVYMNGNRDERSIRRALAPGEMTDSIDLEGDKRFIREVIVHFRPQSSGRFARLQLLGDDLGAGPGHGGPQSAPVQPVPRGWVMFGSQDVGMRTERDTIRVAPEMGVFDKIGLRILNNDVQLREITVNYYEGGAETFTPNVWVSAGVVTQGIELQSNGRHIREIQLVYRSRPNVDGNAVVEVYGDYARNWLSGAGKGHNGGWLLLGSQRAGMFKRDDDAYTVGRHMGGFRAISFKVHRNNVRVNWVRVNYAGGQTEDVQVNRVLSAGETSPPFDLRGRGAREIETVQINYQADLSLRGDAIVELWGQR